MRASSRTYPPRVLSAPARRHGHGHGHATDSRRVPRRTTRVPVGHHSALPVATCLCAALELRVPPAASAAARAHCFGAARFLPLAASLFPTRARRNTLTLTAIYEYTASMSVEQMPCRVILAFMPLPCGPLAYFMCSPFWFILIYIYIHRYPFDSAFHRAQFSTRSVRFNTG